MPDMYNQLYFSTKTALRFVNRNDCIYMLLPFSTEWRTTFKTYKIRSAIFF